MASYGTKTDGPFQPAGVRGARARVHEADRELAGEPGGHWDHCEILRGNGAPVRH